MELFSGYAFLGIIILLIIFTKAFCSDSKYKRYYKTLIEDARFKKSNIIVTTLLCQKKYHFTRDIEFGVENTGYKVIKYITFNFDCFNNVNDYLYSCEYAGSGFISKGQQVKYQYGFNDSYPSYIELTGVEVVYEDGEKKYYDKKDLTIGKGYFIDETDTSLF